MELYNNPEVFYMNMISLISIECMKIRRSKIAAILLIPVILMWLPSILNASVSFDTQGIPITPEHNFFIQGFLGMVWFMIPATFVICTVLLIQTERSNRGFLKMLALPVHASKFCLAKFAVLILLAVLQMIFCIAAYYVCAAIISHTQNYDFILEPLYVCRIVASLYLATLPMISVFWLLATWISTPIFSIGAGLASIVPSVLIINTKWWFLDPMSYPFYVLMTEYGKAAKGIYETQIRWIPWIPVAAVILITSVIASCMMFGYKERR